MSRIYLKCDFVNLMTKVELLNLCYSVFKFLSKASIKKRHFPGENEYFSFFCVNLLYFYQGRQELNSTTDVRHYQLLLTSVDCIRVGRAQTGSYREAQASVLYTYRKCTDYTRWVCYS
jgi:hypothetical protein